MYKEMITLSGVEDVKKFVAIVNNYKCNINLVSGQYIIDAKSIMSIFSLDLSKQLEFQVEDCPEQLKEDIKEFIVK